MDAHLLAQEMAQNKAEWTLQQASSSAVHDGGGTYEDLEQNITKLLSEQQEELLRNVDIFLN